MFRNIHIWLGSYLKHLYLKRKEGLNKGNVHCNILFSICDHFEPYWENSDDHIAYNRVKSWVDNYQLISSKHKDSLGNHPQYCFYYPIEEYRKDYLEMIGEICRNGFGEAEVHLHHDNDNSENLHKTLSEYKKKLYNEHGLLCKNRFNNMIQYGFIHGNWALDNSRPDGRWCGVDDEITVLQETGCYADFTMPSAPSNTQTSTVNSIYYAIDDPNNPKSHNTGRRAIAGVAGQKGLLCIQGPLCLNIYSRKLGVFPRIENGCLSNESPPSTDRMRLWLDQHIHVKGRPDIIFIKLYAHGSQEKYMDLFFKENALDHLFSMLETFSNDHSSCRLFYVSSRQMYNIVKGLESKVDASPESLLDSELVKQT